MTKINKEVMKQLNTLEQKYMTLYNKTIDYGKSEYTDIFRDNIRLSAVPESAFKNVVKIISTYNHMVSETSIKLSEFNRVKNKEILRLTEVLVKTKSETSRTAIVDIICKLTSYELPELYK